MIEDRLINSLMSMDFRKIDSNVPGFYLFYRTADDETSVVSVIHSFTGEELKIEQYEHIIAQIKANFLKRDIPKIHLLSLIFTKVPDKVKRLCLEADDHWIVDMTSNRLLIYETQSPDFVGLKDEIEKIIEDERSNDIRQNDVGDFYNQEHEVRIPKKGFRKTGWLSLMNTIIIIINIIAYFVMHHTDLLGGTEQMMKDGALSWYYVNKGGEYYRLLTSMFMHADIGHLFNNMLVLLFIGDNLERAVGKIKYLLIYFSTGIIAGITSISYNMMKDNALNDNILVRTIVVSIGASGAIFGVVGAMLYILIANRGRLEDINFRQIILFALLSLYGGIANVGIDVAAHIGGFVAGLVVAIILYRRPKRNSSLQ